MSLQSDFAGFKSAAFGDQVLQPALGGPGGVQYVQKFIDHNEVCYVLKLSLKHT